MQSVNEFQFYELAIAIHPLTSAHNDLKYSDIWLDWTSAAEALKKIFQHRALEFCFGAANELYLAIVGVVPEDFQLAAKKWQELASPEPTLGWVVHPVKRAAEKFETILSAELSNSDTYWISPKGTHKTSMLLKSARSMLPASIIGAVPEAASDFDEAGRCWLFDTYTAVGFHLMRAIDAVMRSYYRAAVGVEPKVKFRNWGAYIKRLRGCPNADQKIVDFLDQIKESYRNPVLHPDQNLTAEDAQILFGVAISVVSMMAAAIDSLSAKGGMLPLTETPELPDSV
jgi:hypothetical protein